jgi:hypothetical protein
VDYLVSVQLVEPLDHLLEDHPYLLLWDEGASLLVVVDLLLQISIVCNLHDYA